MPKEQILAEWVETCFKLTASADSDFDVPSSLIVRPSDVKYARLCGDIMYLLLHLFIKTLLSWLVPLGSHGNTAYPRT